jgi:hypothetical protein
MPKLEPEFSLDSAWFLGLIELELAPKAELFNETAVSVWPSQPCAYAFPEGFQNGDGSLHLPKCQPLIPGA